MKTPLLYSLLALVWIVAPGVDAQPKEPPVYKPAANADEAIQHIEELGGMVRRASAKDKDLEVDFRNSQVADVHLQYLHALPSVTIVRLRDTRVTDAGLVHLGKIETLRRLHLEKTAVTDAGLKALVGLKELELLNLYGVSVSDAGLDHLKALPKLKSLFVAESKVTPEGIARLQKAIAGLRVVPDPIQDREQAEAAWKIAVAAREEGERKLAAAKKGADELAPQAAQLKKEFEERNKKSAEAKKTADAARKKFEEANKRANDLQAQAEATRKQSQGKPDDVGLKKLADAKRTSADEAKELAARDKLISDEAQNEFKSVQSMAQALQKTSAIANNAKKNFEEAQKHLENYRTLEADARKRLDELRISAPK